MINYLLSKLRLLNNKFNGIILILMLNLVSVFRRENLTLLHYLIYLLILSWFFQDKILTESKLYLGEGEQGQVTLLNTYDRF